MFGPRSQPNPEGLGEERLCGRPQRVKTLVGWLENVDSGVPEERERVAKMLGDVLRNTAMRVHVDGVPKPGTSALRFIQTLRKRTHLHFA